MLATLPDHVAGLDAVQVLQADQGTLRARVRLKAGVGVEHTWELLVRRLNLRGVAMSLRRQLGGVRRAIGKGVFPQQFSWLLELRARRLLLSPARLAARLRVEPKLSVLEVGAGSGLYSIDVARQLTQGRLVVADIQPGMLQRCRAKAVTAGLANVEYVVSDAATLPFADAAFDLVYLVAVLGEVHDADRAVAEIRRVLRPSGVLSISEHLPDPDFTTRTTLRSRLHRCGFVLIAEKGPWWAYTASFRVGATRGA